MRFAKTPRREKRQLKLVADSAQVVPSVELFSSGASIFKVDTSGAITAPSITSASTLTLSGGNHNLQVVSGSGVFVDGTSTGITMLANVVQVGPSGQYLWGTTSSNGSKDLGLARSAAGVLKITDSSSGGGSLIIGKSDSSSGGTALPGLQITPTYAQSSTAGGTDLLINRTQTSIGSGSQLLIDAQVGSTSYFSVSNTGTVTAGDATSPIKIQAFSGQASWMDIPAVAGKASGIGSGGPGVNPWVAYAGNNGHWFLNSTAGDICYRNQSGGLRFGTSSGDSQFVLTTNGLYVPSFQNGVWHGSADGSNRFFFATTSTSYWKSGLGATTSAAHTWRNTSDTDLMYLSGSGTLTVVQAAISGVVTLTDASTVNTDAALANTFAITLNVAGASRTFAAPTNPVAGQKILYQIKQDGTGSRTITWSATFRFSGGTAPTLTTTASKTDYIGFVYNGVDSKWDCLAERFNF